MAFDDKKFAADLMAITRPYVERKVNEAVDKIMGEIANERVLREREIAQLKHERDILVEMIAETASPTTKSLDERGL